MKIKSIIQLIIYPLLLNSFQQQISSQYADEQVIGQLNAYFNEMYGLDQQLIRGIQYYDKYPRSMGNAFLGSDDFANGRLVINGVVYDQVSIRYDIYNQQVNLQFNYNPTTVNTVILNRDNIEEFEMNGVLVRKYFFPETDTSFFQIVKEDRITCLYYWYKILSYQTSLKYTYEFSDPLRKSYLLIDSVLYRYNGRRSFIKLFPDNKSELRKHFSQNNIKLRNASDQTVKKLIEYCDSLLEPVIEE